MNDQARPDTEPSAVRALLERALVALARRRLLLAGCCLLAAWLAVIAAPHLPLTWTSELVMQLRKSLATATSEDAGMDPTETDGKITEDYREVQTELLQSDLLHRAVAARMQAEGLDGARTLIGTALAACREAPPPAAAGDALIRSVAAAMVVRRPLKSPIVTIQASHSDPAIAQRMLQILVEEYDRALRSLYDVDPILAAARDQAAAAATQLQCLRSEMAAIGERIGSIDPAADLAVARGQLAELHKQLALHEATRAEAAARAAKLEAGEPLPAGFPSEPTRLENKRRIALLNLLEEAKRRLLESPFLDGTPEYAALRAPVAQIEAELAQEAPFVTAENPPLPNTAQAHFATELRKVAADAAAADAAAATMRQQVTELRERIATLQAAVAAQAALAPELERRSQVAADKREIAHRVQRVREMQDAEHLWSYRLIQEPTRPTLPRSPGRRLAMLLVFAAGACLGLAITLAVGMLDVRIGTAAEVAACTGAPPLLCLPDLGSRRTLRTIAAAVAATAPAPLRDASPPQHFASLGAVGRLLEARLDQLLANALPAESATGPCLLVVAAPHAGAGTTTIAINLAARLARRRREVVELRCLGAAAPFAGELPPGVVLGHGDAAARDATGAAPRLVVVDAPPVLESEATLDACATATACLLVARGDMTPRAALREAAQQVLAVAAGRVGVILNALDLRLPRPLQSV